MKSSKFVLGLLASPLIWLGVSTAQNMPLDSLVQMALHQNPAIRAAESQYRALQSQPGQVSALPDPTLSYTRWLKAVETRVGPQENVLMLSQRFPFPGKLHLRGQMAEAEASAGLYHLEKVRRDVIFKLKTAYFALYHIDRSTQVLRQYEDLLAGFARVATTRYTTGQGIQAEVLKAQVEVSNVIAQRLTFEKSRAGLVSQVNALLDRPIGTGFAQVTALEVGRIPRDQEQLLNLALARKQELLVQKSRIEKAGYARKLARKQYLPDFNLQATYITIPKSNDLQADSGKDPFGVMLGINLPLWFGSRKAGVARAQAELVSEQHRYEDLTNQVTAEITTLGLQLDITEQTLDLYEQGLLTQAESSLQSATSAYRAGRLDFLNLLDAERTLLQLRLAHINLQADYAKKLAALERATGVVAGGSGLAR